MLNDRRVEFSEFAEAGLHRLIADDSRRAWAKQSMKFYLRRDAEDEAVLCPAFDDRQLFVFAFYKYRVLFEISDQTVHIWSVSDITLDTN